MGKITMNKIIVIVTLIVIIISGGIDKLTDRIMEVVGPTSKDKGKSYQPWVWMF